MYTLEISGRQSLCRVLEATRDLVRTISPLLSPDSGWWEEGHVGAVEARQHHLSQTLQDVVWTLTICDLYFDLERSQAVRKKKQVSPLMCR